MKKMEMMPADLRFSIDIESSGLEKEVTGEMPYLLELALVPVSASQDRICYEHAFHIFLKAPTVEQMKREGKLSRFVEQNANLMEVCHVAHLEGLEKGEAIKAIQDYIFRFQIQNKDGEKLSLLGKSMAGLDISLFKKFFSASFFEACFNHKVLDITSYQLMLDDFGVNYPRSRKEEAHTALEDAIEVCNEYLVIGKSISSRPA